MAVADGNADQMDFQWIGPEHTVPEIRAVKRHLDSGGIVFVCRSPDEKAAIIAKGAHGRTEKAGAVLNVSSHSALDQTNPLAQEIDLIGACFIGRTIFPHDVFPTVRYYAYARTGLPSIPPSTGFSQRFSHLTLAWDWIRSSMSYTFFMFTQGWLTGAAIQHPVFAFPILTVVYAS